MLLVGFRHELLRHVRHHEVARPLLPTGRVHALCLWNGEQVGLATLATRLVVTEGALYDGTLFVIIGANDTAHFQFVCCNVNVMNE